MQTPAANVKPEPKVIQPHPWAGRMAYYWRETKPGEISPLPAMLIAQTRATDGCWDLNFWRQNHMQGRSNVRHSAVPKAGCFTFPPDKAKK